MLRGTITALVTPMTSDGAVDYNSLNDLVEFQINSGIIGLVVLGSTGESATLNNEEKMKIIDYIIGINSQRVKIVVGINYANTADATKFAKNLNNNNGVDYVMVLTPYYVKPTQEGLYNHFASVAQISSKPIILYNVPSRTGCDLKDDTILSLVNKYSNIVGLKDATGDISRCCYLTRHRPSHLMLYSGDDATAMGFMLCGGDGVISVVSNLVPQQMVQIGNFAISGDKVNAISENHKIIDLYDSMFIETNPIPIKWALYYKGIIHTPTLRLPLTTLNQKYWEQIKQTVNKCSS